MATIITSNFPRIRVLSICPIAINRKITVQSEPKSKPITDSKRKMKGWQIHSYGETEEVQFSDKLKIPSIRCATDVLVKVNATAVNPIDVAMVGGYGSKLINMLRCNRDGIEFPITLGREFSGIVSQKGMGLCQNLKIGDTVWGVVPIHRNGCHSEYVVVPEFCLNRQPVNLNSKEASSLLYAGLTAWSGLFLTGKLGGLSGFLTSNGGGKGKRVLVLGASGGVGSIAVQILRAENVNVIATCSTDAIDMVTGLGAQHVIDYTNQAQLNELTECGPYDVILDCAGQGPKYAEQFGWQFKDYITFSSPLLKNMDESGLGLGMIKNLIDLVETNTKSITTKQGCIKWGYFIPAPQGIEYLKKLVERKKLLPLIDSTFEFEKADEAYKKVKDGHLRGKVVIDLETKSKN